MKIGLIQKFGFALSVMALVLSTGCAGKKQKSEEGSGSSSSAVISEENAMGDSDSGHAFGLQTVHFPYDSFTLDATAKDAIKANAQIMKGRPMLKIQIEGHCDQRGGIQYNIALGEKRANATRRYMEDSGISSDRMTVISYGKEKPVDSNNSDAAYAKNRRANFVITSQ